MATGPASLARSYSLLPMEDQPPFHPSERRQYSPVNANRSHPYCDDGTGGRDATPLPLSTAGATRRARGSPDSDAERSQAAAIVGRGQGAQRAGRLVPAASAYIAAGRLYHVLGDVEGLARCFDALVEVYMATRAKVASDSLREAAAVAPAGSSQQRRGDQASGVGESTAATDLPLRPESQMRLRDGAYHLTAAERAVAALVGEGLTNLEIARHRGISPRTVQAHLTRVFAKVGVSTRTALARKVNEWPRRPDDH
ncbi:MAG: helix-turn-helix transcriptional regulator [Mycobacterium sp.]